MNVRPAGVAAPPAAMNWFEVVAGAVLGGACVAMVIAATRVKPGRR